MSFAAEAEGRVVEGNVRGGGLDWSVSVAANRWLGGSSPRQCRSQDNLSPPDRPEI